MSSANAGCKSLAKTCDVFEKSCWNSKSGPRHSLCASG